MDLTRKQVIEILEKADYTVYKEPKTKTAQALEYAINSLKTDEMYQIMYEGGEIFTKDEVIDMFKKLALQIDEEIPQMSPDAMRGFYWEQGLVQDFIEAKIKDLKGGEDEIS